MFTLRTSIAPILAVGTLALIGCSPNLGSSGMQARSADAMAASTSTGSVESAPAVAPAPAPAPAPSTTSSSPSGTETWPYGPATGPSPAPAPAPAPTPAPVVSSPAPAPAPAPTPAPVVSNPAPAPAPAPTPAPIVSNPAPAPAPAPTPGTSEGWNPTPSPAPAPAPTPAPVVSNPAPAPAPAPTPAPIVSNPAPAPAPAPAPTPGTSEGWNPSPSPAPAPAPSPAPGQSSSGSSGGLVCDPFQNGSTTTAQGGVQAHLFYLGQNQTQYADVEDYINHGYESKDQIVMNEINVPTRYFSRGFQETNGSFLQTDTGTTLFEWFALAMEGSIKLGPNDVPGDYQIAVLSDDGSILRLQTQPGQAYQQWINNDGETPTRMRCATQIVHMNTDTVIPFQLDYFQGPRYEMAVVVMWRKVDPTNSHSMDESLCDQFGNNLFWDPTTSNPEPAFNQLQSDGWKILGTDNYQMPNGNTNPCVTGTSSGSTGGSGSVTTPPDSDNDGHPTVNNNGNDNDNGNEQCTCGNDDDSHVDHDPANNGIGDIQGQEKGQQNQDQDDQGHDDQGHDDNDHARCHTAPTPPPTQTCTCNQEHQDRD